MHKKPGLMMTGSKLFSRNDLIACSLLLLFALQSFMAIRSTSATFDEGQNYGIGKYLLQQQKWDLMGCILQPPLSHYVSSLPLFFSQEDKSVWQYEQQDRDLTFLSAVDIYRAQALLSAPGNANDRLLISSRLMILLAFGIPLGYYIYRFSSDLHGKAGGVLSLFLFAFCPNMIAYSGIINSDMPFCALAFISCYYFRIFLHQESLKSAMITGLVTGLALTTKLNALLLIFGFLLIYAVHWYRAKNCSPFRMVVLVSIAIFVLFLSYGFNITPYLQGYQLRMMQMHSGFKTFFNGNYSLHGWWFFYPVVFLVKTPISGLILASIALYSYLRKWRENWFDTLYLYSPVIFVMVFYTFSNIAAGVRFLLPLYPFLFVTVGSLVDSCKCNRKFMYLLATWYASSALFIAPHYLSYFNEFLGGPDKAYKYLVDSNLDWGQDLKGLKKYMDEHDIKKIGLSYFGIDSPKRYGIDYDWLPSFYLINPTPGKIATAPENRYVAISATNLQGVYLDDRETFAWFRQFEPVAKIGYSIFVYDLTKLPQVTR
jgi:hypothetical protein